MHACMHAYMHTYIYRHIDAYIHIYVLGWFTEIEKQNFFAIFNVLLLQCVTLLKIINTVNFLKFSVTISGCSSSKKI